MEGYLFTSVKHIPFKITKPDAEQSRARAEAHYAELLLSFLTSTSRSMVELRSGSIVPDLTELIIDPTNQWQLESFAFDREKINADVIIDILLRRVGWRCTRLSKRRASCNYR